MKTPALPTRITSLFAFLMSVFLAAAAILTLLALLFTGTSRAATIAIGSPNATYFGILGLQSGNAPTHREEYQQVYASSGFPGAAWITQIAFMSATNARAIDANYNISLSLGLTKKTPLSTDNAFETALMPVFSGILPAHLTATQKDYDLFFNLPTPFYYDPAAGNLVLDLVRPDVPTRRSQAGIGYFCGEPGTKLMETVSDFQGNQRSGEGTVGLGIGIVQAIPSDGLTTRFTTAPVPEPGAAGLLLLGAAVCGRRRVHRRVPAFLPKGEPAGNAAVTP